MMEMVNILDIIKAFKIKEVYCPFLGMVSIETDKEGIIANGTQFSYRFNQYGQLVCDNTTQTECMLYPSKEIRDWDKVGEMRERLAIGAKALYQHYITDVPKDFKYAPTLDSTLMAMVQYSSSFKLAFINLLNKYKNEEF